MKNMIYQEEIQRVLLYGYSNGGQGVPYVVTHTELKGYFDKAIVIDGGYNTNLKEAATSVEMKGYGAANSNQGKSFMQGTFRQTVGDDKLTVVGGANHSTILKASYEIDENGNGISDMLEWIYDIEQ